MASAQKQIRADLQRLGELQSLALVERREESGLRSYRYVVDFAKARVLGRYVMQSDNKVTLFQSEFVVPRPGMNLGAN